MHAFCIWSVSTFLNLILLEFFYCFLPSNLTTCTVSRPLFIEEHGLRLLLDKEGVGVELSRQSYEAGDWACAVGEALEKGREAKKAKRRVMGCDSGGVDKHRRDQEGRRLAGQVVDWVRGWWSQEEEEEGGDDYLGVRGGCRLDEMKDS